MGITEIGTSIAKANVEFGDETTLGGKIQLEAWKKAVSQPTGPFRIYWGNEVEDPSNTWGFFDFASVEEHAKFAKEYGPEVVKDFPKILSRPGFTKHVDMKPYPPTALRAPVTEILLAWFPPDISQELRDANTKKVELFAEKSLKACPDIHTINVGWGVENDFPVRGGEEGQKGTLLAVFVGWSSIDAHVKFRGTDEFKEAIPLIRGLEGTLKLTMFHVKCGFIENETRKEE